MGSPLCPAPPVQHGWETVRLGPRDGNRPVFFRRNFFLLFFSFFLLGPFLRALVSPRCNISQVRGVKKGKEVVFEVLPPPGAMQLDMQVGAFIDIDMGADADDGC